MKKVLLISSWTNEKKVLGYYLSPPIGVYRLQRWLQDRHDVDVLDPNLDDPIEFLKSGKRYDVIGFSPTKDNLHNDIFLMRYCRLAFPSAVQVLGGVEATCNHQQMLTLTGADYIVLNEGEKALAALLDNLTSLSLPPSIVTNQFSYSTVLNADEIALANDLDYNRMRVREYWSRNSAVTGGDLLSTNCINMYITNYCPQGCKFCSTTRFIRQACPAGTKVVAIPPLALVDLITKVLAQLPDTKTIYFHDDNACHYRQMTIDWCRASIRQGIDVSYIASSRINHFDAEILDVMKRAGFRKLSVGIEAYSDPLLRKMGKGQTVKMIDDFIELTRKMDMPLNINLMLCVPEADSDDVKRTAEFALRMLENRNNTVTVHPYVKAYAGSWYHDNWDLIEYRYSTVPSGHGVKGGDAIRIPHRFLPRDAKVREILMQLDHAMENSPDFIKMKTDSFLMSQFSEKLCQLLLELQ